MAGEGSQRGEQGRRPAAAAFDSCFEPLAAIVRGPAVESVIRGGIAVVDAGGDLLGAVGDPCCTVLLRSSAKPFQAAAFVASGGADAFALSDDEIAVIAASHIGAAEHVAVVQRLLQKAEVPESALVCGSLEHNCSGKHAGMLLFARHRGVPVEGYERPEHPVQRAIHGYVGTLLEGWARGPRFAAAGAAGPAGLSASARLKRGSASLFAGTDNCGVPVLSMTLQEAAWLFARLAAGATPDLVRVRDAMAAHPSLVAGEGRLDTNLMRAAAGGIVSKSGAEGVLGLGLLASGARPRPAGTPAPAMGCAMKVEDGSGRAIPAVAAAVLRAWGYDAVAAAVEKAHPPGIDNQAGQEVARIEALIGESAVRRPRYRAGRAGGRAAGDAAQSGAGAAGAAAGALGPVVRRVFGYKVDNVTVSRADHRDVLRFLREQWPAVDNEYFGRPLEWTAEPYVLVYRRDRKVAGVLKGHFIGGLASVDELMVAADARGRGLGSLLLGRFEDEARRRRCSRIVLRAVKGTPAEDFYRKRGYHRECVQYGYEFGYDYVRLTCETEHALGEAEGPPLEPKGGS